MKPTDSNPSKNYDGAAYSPSSVAPSVGIIGTPSTYPRLVVQPAPSTPAPKTEPTEDKLETPASTLSPVGVSSLSDTAQVLDTQPYDNPPSLAPLPHGVYGEHAQRFSVFHLNRTALLITIAVVSFIALVGLGSLVFSKASSKSSKSSTSTNSTNTSPTNQYAVGSLPLTNLSPTTTELQISGASKLAVNGQLQVNNTLVLTPGATPTSPTIGQLYYDKTTNQPYFYNGNQFVSLQPTTQASSTTATSSTATSPQSTITTTVTSLGGSTGTITLGSSLTMTANQLDVAGALLASLNASNITSGTVADARLSANVNLQGNTFNGASQLVQLNASSQLPAISAVNLINLNGSNISSGTVADARLSANVTVQGNAFNGIAQLIKTNASGEIPILSGINITNLNGSNISSGTVADSHLSANVTVQGNTFNGASQLLQLTAGGILPAVDGSNLNNINASHVSSGTISDSRLSTNVTVQGNTFNGVNQLLQLTAGGIIPAIDGSNLKNLNASSVTSGTVVDARLSNNVTLQGNIFNGSSQLVQTTAGGILPVISGANLTSVNGSNITLGTVADARLSVNVAFLNNVSREFFAGNIAIGTVSTSSTSTLFVNGVIESWGGLKLPANASAPFTCIPAASGTISLTLFFVTCVCNGSSWVFTNDGSTACNWLPVPLIPTIGTASDAPTGRPYNNGLATVYFTPSATGPVATSFTVTSSPGGSTGTGTSSPITVAGLQSGVLYTFTVTATNANGTSNPSAASNAITTTTSPQAPTIGMATDSGTGRPYNNGLATVSYTANGTGGAAVTYTANASAGGYSGSGSSPISFTGLQSATAYSFTVTATNVNGSATSAASNTIIATTVPQAPMIGTATATGNHTATVAYTANGTGGLTNTYTVSPGSGSGVSPISISGLAVATSYSFTVTAANSNGSSTSAVSNTITTTGSIVSGGAITNDGTYYYRTFTSNGTFTVSGAPLNVSVLTVGGGGGGGGTNAGSGYGSEGGGGGGSTVLSNFSAASSYPIVVGLGGSGGNTFGGSGSPGTASTFNSANSGGGGNGGSCCTLSYVTGGTGTYTGGSGGAGSLNYNTPGNGANGPSVGGFGAIASNFGGGGGGSGGAGGLASGWSYIGSNGAGSYGQGGAAGNQLYGGGSGSTNPGSNGAAGVVSVRYLMSAVD